MKNIHERDLVQRDCYFIDNDKHLRIKLEKNDRVGDRIFLISSTGNLKRGIYEIIDIDETICPDYPIYIIKYVPPEILYTVISMRAHRDVIVNNNIRLRGNLKEGDLFVWNKYGMDSIMEVIYKTGLTIYVSPREL